MTRLSPHFGSSLTDFRTHATIQGFYRGLTIQIEHISVTSNKQQLEFAFGTKAYCIPLKLWSTKILYEKCKGPTLQSGLNTVRLLSMYKRPEQRKTEYNGLLTMRTKPEEPKILPSSTQVHA
jgi:hypothetical protein